MDKWIKVVLKKGRTENTRSIFVVLGPCGVDQIQTFYELLSANDKGLCLIGCSSNPEAFRNLKIDDKGSSDIGKLSPKITYLNYSDIHDAICQSFDIAVLHNVEDAQPSSLAFIIESVKGSGLILFLFDQITTLDDLNSSSTSSFTKSRFIKRLCASFQSCSSCLVLNDKLEVLSHPKDVSSFKDLKKSSYSKELMQLKSENMVDPITGPLVDLCHSKDQVTALMKFIDVLKKKAFHSTISISSAKGRGKSATLGLAIAASLALNYSNIFISSLSYENVKVIFKFLFKGLDALNYQEDQDYDLIQSINPKFKNALLGINVFKDHPQAVRFILPGDVENKLEQAELVIIDEAAAIPPSLLNRLMGSYIVLMASTIEGCCGTGKFLYKQMVREICQPASVKNENKVFESVTLYPTSEKSFEKLSLTDPIFYASGDEVESWIDHLLCLESSLSSALSHGCPEPQQCQLFYINQEVLFSYESHAENFLQQVMSLLMSSKRTICPDILSKIANEPDYHLFCLLSPFSSSIKAIPEILCAILVHDEKQIPSNIIYSGINQEENSVCFNDWRSICDNSEEFSSYHGVHILDIVTHPEYRRMKYGSRAITLLQEFYDNKWIPIDDKPFVYSCVSKAFNINKDEPASALLLQLSEVEPQKVDFLLSSYSLSAPLLRFWKKSGFVPLFISREKNSAQENSCLMIKALSNEFQPFLQESWRCFSEYFFIILSSELKSLPSSFTLSILKSSSNSLLPKRVLTKEDIDVYLNPQRMKSLEKYCQNLSDLHSVMPSVPVLTKLYFRECLSGVVLPVLQEVILLAFGLQHKTIDEISKELGLPSSQVHGLLNRTIRKLNSSLSAIIEAAVEKTIKSREVNMQPVAQDLNEELEEAAESIKQQQMEQSQKLKDMDFSQYAIKGSEDDWEKALHSGRKTLVSIKSLKKPPEDLQFPSNAKNSNFKSKKTHQKKRKR